MPTFSDNLNRSLKRANAFTLPYDELQEFQKLQMPAFEENLDTSLRNVNAFKPESTILQDFRSQPDVANSDIQEPITDVESLLRQNYNPQTEMRDKFNKSIDEYPIRDKPSFGRKVLASLAGFAGGPGAAEESLDLPYKRNLEDWKTRTGVLQDAATRESVSNRDQASFASSEARNLIQEQRANIAEQNSIVAQGRLENEIIKNNRIYEVETNKLAQRINEQDNNLKRAYDELQFRQNSADAMLNFRNTQMSAINERAEADRAIERLKIANLEANRDIQARLANERVATANARLALAGLPTITEDEAVDRDDKGNVTKTRRTVTRGEVKPVASHGTVVMVDKNGKEYDVDSTKVSEAETKYKLKRK
jgi:hypothetical protein